MILKYIVGWAFGNACTQLLVELKAANPDVNAQLFDFSFTLLLTAVSGLLVILFFPLTKEIEFGTGRVSAIRRARAPHTRATHAPHLAGPCRSAR